MTSDELADEVASRVAASIPRIKARITGVGHEQYDLGGMQRFETRDPARILREALEEADDLQSYIAMFALRLQVLLDAFERGAAT